MNVQPSIVLTGAAGFIGRRVAARLAAAGARVLAVDRVPRPAGFPPGAEYRGVDLGNEVLNAGAASVLVHLAWNMDRANSEAQAESVAVFVRLLESGQFQGVVGLGSAEEYGEREGRLREDLAPGAHLSAYGRAKHEAGRALEAWARGAPGRRAIWLRPFVVYGPGQGGSMAIPYAVQCARARTPAEFSEGLQRRDFVHVDDVAEGVAQAARRVAEPGEPFAACNLGRGAPVRLRAVLERIARRTQAEELFRFGARPLRANEPQEQFADVAAAERRLGWRAQISWETGVDELCGEGGP